MVNGDYVLCENCRLTFVLVSQPKIKGKQLCVSCAGKSFVRKITKGRGYNVA